MGGRNLAVWVLSRCWLINVFLAGTNASASNWTDLSGKGVKLVGKRHHVTILDHELAFANHVHQLDTRENAAGSPK